MEELRFRYVPRCSVPGCEELAAYKIAAPWSDGTSRELKNYGLACTAHRQTQFDRAVENHGRLAVDEGEAVGTVRIYQLISGVHDLDLREWRVENEE